MRDYETRALAKPRFLRGEWRVLVGDRPPVEARVAESLVGWCWRAVEAVDWSDVYVQIQDGRVVSFRLPGAEVTGLGEAETFNRLVEVQADLARLSLRVRDLVNHGSLTKREIANRMGVSPSTVDRVLLKPHLATVEMLAKLVWAMGSRLDVQVGE